MEVMYHRTAYVEVDTDIFCVLDDNHPWVASSSVICHTVERLHEMKEEVANDSLIGEFLIELLANFQVNNFDGDVIFELED